MNRPPYHSLTVADALRAGLNRAFIKIKRSETFDCTVIAKHESKQSIALSLNGEPCGWCPCFTGFNRVKIGDVVEIEAMRRNPSGRFREPRIIRSRKDKVTA